jgi:biotin transporter BioY
MHITAIGLQAALMMCVVPFLIGDAVKILAAAILTGRLYKLV